MGKLDFVPARLRGALLLAVVSACALPAGAAPFAYVANNSSGTVSVIDVALNAVTATIAVGGSPWAVAINPFGSRAYVTNYSGNSVAVISTTSNAVVATVPVGSGPRAIAVNPAGTFAYVANENSNNVSVINLSTNSVAATVSVGSGPSGIAVNPAGTFAYVPNGAVGSRSVSVIATATNTVTATVTVGNTPTDVAINPAGTFAYVTNFNGSSVSVINTATNTVTATVPVGIYPWGIAASPAGNRVFVANSGSNTVSVINTATNAVIANVALGGSNPESVAITPNAALTYVTLGGSGSVAVIDNSNYSLVGGVVVGSVPSGVAIVMPPAGPATSSPPVFPVTVNVTNPTPSTVAATAQVQPRTQDVGSRASVYVFAHAPANLVRGATATARAPVGGPWPAAEDDAILCVLAQVENGELVGVKPETMKEFLKDIVLAQNLEVKVLDSVRIQAVAGGSMFIGYGATAAAMLANGVYQTALTVAGGAVQCTSSTDSAPAPKTPGALSGLWWNASEPGWGITFTQRGTNVFAAWYTYDLAGNAKWYVSTCALPNASATTCSGQLFEVNGPRYFGVAFDPSQVHATAAGNLQVTFPTINTATMTYSGVAGAGRTVSLARQPLSTGTTSPAIDYTDLWWNPSESGWGVSITHQYGVAFLAWYVFDANGAPTWSVATCTMSGSSCSGTLYQTRGPGFAGPFNPSLVQPFPIGSVIVSFIDANNAVLSYTVNGVAATKTIARQLF